MIRKDLIIAVLTTFCLTVILFTIIPIRSSPYDPWLDTNDDGHIDGKELGDVAAAFGTYGNPINKTALLYDVNATFTELLSRIDSSNASLVDLQGRVTALESIALPLNDTISDIQSRIDTLNASLLDIVSRTDSLNASIINVQSRTTSLEEEVAQLQNNVTMLQENIASLSSTVTLLQTTVTTLQTNFALMNASLASLNNRISALEANYSITNLEFAPNAIPFNSTHVSYINTTQNFNFEDLPFTSVNITLQRTSHLLIFFSADASNNLLSDAGDYCIEARALVGDSTALPGSVYLTPIVGGTGFTGLPNHRHTLGYSSYSYNFYEPSLSPGTYTIKIQWCVTGGTGYVSSRTLTVIALPA